MKRMVRIGGDDYLFSNEIGCCKEQLQSFNTLAQKTFGLSFAEVGGEYEPHVLMKEDKVCANVSVNQIPFSLQGEEILAIQLGTVMTEKSMQKRGLSKWLLAYIIEQWKERCDILYLFANDSVLSFYPKFGFRECKEWGYTYLQTQEKETILRKMDMGNPKDRELVKRCYAYGNPYSAFGMIRNRAIFDFYCEGFWKENIYYSEAHKLLYLLEEQENGLLCYDIFGGSNVEIEQALNGIQSEKRKIILGFAPKEKSNFNCTEYKEEGITLFIHEMSRWRPDEKQKLMFPLISHA